jgi:transcriptional regulator of heat shock response
MNALTARQTQILKALIDEYINTAEPVGSSQLEKKYDLGVSPATIRNEMNLLTKSGFLKQPHTSAGRVPTSGAMKFYVDQLMEEKQMSLADEVKAKEEVWDERGNFEKFVNEMTHSLADRTGNMAITVTEDGNVWQAGHANIFSYPEFGNIAACASLFGFMDEDEQLIDLFFNRFPIETPFDVLFTEDMGFRHLPIGIVAAHFKVKGKNGALGVIGPVRQSYSSLVPTIRYYRGMLEEVMQ